MFMELLSTSRQISLPWTLRQDRAFNLHDVFSTPE